MAGQQVEPEVVDSMTERVNHGREGSAYTLAIVRKVVPDLESNISCLRPTALQGVWTQFWIMNLVLNPRRLYSLSRIHLSSITSKRVVLLGDRHWGGDNNAPRWRYKSVAPKAAPHQQHELPGVLWKVAPSSLSNAATRSVASKSFGYRIIQRHS